MWKWMGRRPGLLVDKLEESLGLKLMVWRLCAINHKVEELSYNDQIEAPRHTLIGGIMP